MGLKLSIAVSGYSPAAKRLEKLMAIAKRPSVPMRQCAVWLTGQTMQAFSEGGRPEKWAPLSLMTLFIRAHRAEGPKTKSATPLVDTGRLKGSFVPVVSDDGSMFGSATNVQYASQMQKGGVTEASEVTITNFTRKLRGGDGKARKTKRHVEEYVIHFKGGAKIPARPFFPEGIRQLDAWGYHDKIKQIFADYFKGELS